MERVPCQFGVTDEETYKVSNMTAVFVARNPKPQDETPCRADSHLRAGWLDFRDAMQNSRSRLLHLVKITSDRARRSMRPTEGLLCRC